MTELVTVLHSTGDLVVDEEAIVITITAKRKPPTVVRVPLARGAVKVDGTDVSVYLDGKIERMVVRCGPPDQLERLVAAVPIHEPPAADQAGPGVQVKTYRNVGEYENDARIMAAAGWLPQGQVAGRGKVNMGRTVAKGAVFLPWALMRPSRKDDPITVTWVRT